MTLSGGAFWLQGAPSDREAGRQIFGADRSRLSQLSEGSDGLINDGTRFTKNLLSDIFLGHYRDIEGVLHCGRASAPATPETRGAFWARRADAGQTG